MNNADIQTPRSGAVTNGTYFTPYILCTAKRISVPAQLTATPNRKPAGEAKHYFFVSNKCFYNNHNNTELTCPLTSAKVRSKNHQSGIKAAESP